MTEQARNIGTDGIDDIPVPVVIATIPLFGLVIGAIIAQETLRDIKEAGERSLRAYGKTELSTNVAFVGGLFALPSIVASYLIGDEVSKFLKGPTQTNGEQELEYDD